MPGRPAALTSRFEAERAESVAWLRSLEDTQWSRTYDHPEVGPTSALDLLASWVAHDLLHGAQFARLRALAFRASIPELSIRYANPRMG